MTDRSTITIARIAGPVLLITSIALLTRGDAIRDAIGAILESPALALTLGYLTLTLGLATLAVHLHWRGIKEISVTLLGLALTLRGTVLLIAPELIDWLAAPVLALSWFTYAASAITLLLGAWFTYVGIQKPASA